MSWYESYHERISIVNDCEATAKLIGELRQYVEKITKWYNSFDISLSDGEDTVVLSGKLDFARDRALEELRKERGEGADLSSPMQHKMYYYGFLEKMKEHPEWEVEWEAVRSSLLRMLERQDAVGQVTFEWSGSFEVNGSSSFGAYHWRGLFVDPELVGRVDYRTFQTGDFNPGATTFRDNGSGTLQEVPRDASLEVVRDIPKWFGDLHIEFDGVPESKWQAMKERMGAAHEAFVKVIENCSVRLDIFEDSVEESGSFLVNFDHLEEFRERLQKLVDVVAEFEKDAEIDFDLVPAGKKELAFSPFAAIGVECVDGEVVMRACRYDP